MTKVKVALKYLTDIHVYVPFVHSKPSPLYPILHLHAPSTQMALISHWSQSSTEKKIYMYIIVNVCSFNYSEGATRVFFNNLSTVFKECIALSFRTENNGTGMETPLGFIVLGRSPKWPKARSFLGRSPEMFWKGYALRWNLVHFKTQFWEILQCVHWPRRVWMIFSDIVTYIL